MVPRGPPIQLVVVLDLQEALKDPVLAFQEALKVHLADHLQQVGPKCFPQVVAHQKVHLVVLQGLQVVHP